MFVYMFVKIDPHRVAHDRNFTRELCDDMFMRKLCGEMVRKLHNEMFMHVLIPYIYLTYILLYYARVCVGMVLEHCSLCTDMYVNARHCLTSPSCAHTRAVWPVGLLNMHVLFVWFSVCLVGL